MAQRPDWEVVAPVRLQTVCLRHTPAEIAAEPERLSAHNLAWVRALNTSGLAFVSPSLLDDVWMARVSIGAEPTERRHLLRLIELIDERTGPETRDLA